MIFNLFKCKHKSDFIYDILLRLEQRITNLEDEIGLKRDNDIHIVVNKKPSDTPITELIKNAPTREHRVKPIKIGDLL